MKTYSIDHPEKGHISYKDKKRYLWLNSVALPLFPLMGVFLFYKTGLEWTLCLPLLMNYTGFTSIRLVNW